jgi:hypothetical protein
VRFTKPADWTKVSHWIEIDARSWWLHGDMTSDRRMFYDADEDAFWPISVERLEMSARNLALRDTAAMNRARYKQDLRRWEKRPKRSHRNDLAPRTADSPNIFTHTIDIMKKHEPTPGVQFEVHQPWCWRERVREAIAGRDGAVVFEDGKEPKCTCHLRPVPNEVTP